MVDHPEHSGAIPSPSAHGIPLLLLRHTLLSVLSARTLAWVTTTSHPHHCSPHYAGSFSLGARALQHPLPVTPISILR